MPLIGSTVTPHNKQKRLASKSSCLEMFRNCVSTFPAVLLDDTDTRLRRIRLRCFTPDFGVDCQVDKAVAGPRGELLWRDVATLERGIYQPRSDGLQPNSNGLQPSGYIPPVSPALWTWSTGSLFCPRICDGQPCTKRQGFLENGRRMEWT